MLEKLTEEELEFCETLYNPLCLGETLFSDYDNFGAFEDDRTCHIRLGQFALLSYEYLIDTEDPKLTEKQNFKLQEGSGDIWCLGGRRYGKTLFVEKVDILISMLLLNSERVGFTSYDALHIRGVLEDIRTALENHPLFKVFRQRIIRSPTYAITLKNGYILESVNMNLQSKNPGSQFFQKHFSRLYIEEASFETETIYGKRLDSVSENGCVIRASGMTNFTKYSPCGRIFYNLSKRAWIANLPQYINPKWDSKEKQKAVREHGGEQSINYRIFVLGEVVEEGISVFDMERIRPNYIENKRIKSFEITKENYNNFEDIIIVERPTNADNVYIAADVGETAPTEIIIIFEINKKYRYEYNICLHNLTDKQQKKLFRWLTPKLNTNFIGLDTTDQLGRAIYRDLEEIYPKENLIWVGFNEKIAVDFEKDERGNLKFKDGKPIQKEEYVSSWAVKFLKDLLYDNRILLPIDFKFDVQFNSVISMQSGNRTIYQCVSAEDHLYQAFQVFSISAWYNEFKIIHPIREKEYFKSGV